MMEIPYTVEARPDTGWTNGKLAMWLFLASEVMLFGALFSSYVILRAGATDWPRESLNVGAASVNTLLLLASSLMISKARAAATGGDWPSHRRWLWTTVVLGFVFLGIKSFEYSEHLAHGEYPSNSTFLAVYFTLTGFHALHIVGGLLVMLYLLGPGARLYTRNPRHFVNRVECTALYWHFVDVIWLCLFTLLYLV